MYCGKEEFMKIIVDVMGGDNAPKELVKGVYASSLENPEVKYILVGDKTKIERVAEECEIDLSGFTIEHTSEVITMEDDPLCVTRSKSGIPIQSLCQSSITPQSSLRVSLSRVAAMALRCC